MSSIENKASGRIDGARIFFGILSGLLLTGSFPSIGLSGLSLIALVPLFIALQDLSPKKSFQMGLLAGCVHYVTLMYWLVHTMQFYGNLPFFLSIPALFLLSIYLGIYLAVFSAAVSRLLTKQLGFVIFAPVFWVSLEYVRSFLFTGFPWGLLGYSQYNNLHLIQVSDIFGVYGVSYLIVQANGACFLMVGYLKGTHWQGKNVDGRLAFGSIMGAGCLFAMALAYGYFRVDSIDRLVAVSPSKIVSIVQGNIDQAVKWDPKFQKTTVQKYVDLSRSVKARQPDLIVWPETAVPFYYGSRSELTGEVQKGIRDVGTDFLIGSPSFLMKDKTIEYFNSAYLIDERGIIDGKYDKSHLVPFGEYVPFQKWLPFVEKIVQHIGDFAAGKKGQTVPWADDHLGILICYEIIFPDLSRIMVENHASFLVNITNDAWYGKSSAPYQHFSMAIFRAVENKRSLVRSANTGISGFLDPAGRIISCSGIFKEAVMTETIPIIEEATFYTRFGDVFPRVCLLAVIWVLIVKRVYLSVKKAQLRLFK